MNLLELGTFSIHRLYKAGRNITALIIETRKLYIKDASMRKLPIWVKSVGLYQVRARKISR